MPSVDDKPRSGKTDEHYAPEATESRTACMHSTMRCLPVLVSLFSVERSSLACLWYLVPPLYALLPLLLVLAHCNPIRSARGMAWCRSF